jgi:hypothetical protein
MPTDAEIVREMARGMVNGDWEELPELHKVLALAQARKALAAQRAMGLVLVPESLLKAVFEALGTLEPDALGIAGSGDGTHWHIRDELMANLHKYSIAAAQGEE